MDAHRIICDVDRSLPAAPFARQKGSLLIMVGLPGTGKSVVVEKLNDILPCVTVSTDRVRLFMRRYPTYTAAEMMFVYEVCQRVIEQRMMRGQRVVFDGTNYLAARREQMLNLAQRRGATAAICHVQAPQEVIRQRLLQRGGDERREGDLSDADWAVYQWMVAAQEPITGPHLTIDTSSAPPEELAQQLRTYWLSCETTF